MQIADSVQTPTLDALFQAKSVAELTDTEKTRMEVDFDSGEASQTAWLYTDQRHG